MPSKSSAHAVAALTLRNGTQLGGLPAVLGGGESHSRSPTLLCKFLGIDPGYLTISVTRHQRTAGFHVPSFLAVSKESLRLEEQASRIPRSWPIPKGSQTLLPAASHCLVRQGCCPSPRPPFEAKPISRIGD